jgi:hypothetical protein
MITVETTMFRENRLFGSKQEETTTVTRNIYEPLNLADRAQGVVNGYDQIVRRHARSHK